MAVTKINLNGIHELDLQLGGTTTAVISSPGVVEVTNSGSGGGGPVIGFIIGNGAVGNNVGPMLASPSTGTVSRCVVVVKGSDASVALTFRIKQNGTDVFSTDPTISAGASSGTVYTFTTLTSNPLNVSAGDVFSIDIITGSTSWQFTTQLE